MQHGTAKTKQKKEILGDSRRLWRWEEMWGAGNIRAGRNVQEGEPVRTGKHPEKGETGRKTGSKRERGSVILTLRCLKVWLKLAELGDAEVSPQSGWWGKRSRHQA